MKTQDQGPKVGVLIVTHYRLGEEFLQALRLILPEAPVWDTVSVDPTMAVETVRGSIAAGLKAADSGEGVLILRFRMQEYRKIFANLLIPSLQQLVWAGAHHHPITLRDRVIQ